MKKWILRHESGKGPKIPLNNLDEVANKMHEIYCYDKCGVLNDEYVWDWRDCATLSDKNGEKIDAK